MAHLHSVYDVDTHFKIDNVSRQITSEAGQKTTIMQYDHNSERFTFELPRYIEGHDMMLSTSVQVHYLNVSAADKANSNAGVYEVVDLQLSPADEDIVICSWLISQNATQLVGSLNFILRFICSTNEIDYIWNTAIYDKITISNGISNGDNVVEQYADVLEQWEKELFENVSFGWTDFDYSLDYEDNDFNDFVGDNYITSPFMHTITIHCAGEILGFTVSTGDSYYRLKVNGEYVLDNRSYNSIEKTYTMMPTLMNEDIVIELSASSLNFTNMTRRQIRGVGELGNIAEALDGILAIQNSLIGGVSV